MAIKLSRALEMSYEDFNKFNIENNARLSEAYKKNSNFFMIITMNLKLGPTGTPVRPLTLSSESFPQANFGSLPNNRRDKK